MKRSYKLQEFVAHSSNVNCLNIGRKSSGVLVTGGEDKKVNVWAIGKPNAILSLTGHQSPVDCVAFDNAEEVVVAGAQSGTVKLWDLEEAKVVRTLTGHRSNCLSVHFNPFGEYLATGSLDTNLKIWDIRNKGCIQTYKGHTRGVTHVQFSPDGRWVLSGSEDGTVKLWDLTAGKMMHDFTDHTHPITGMEFHPNEFLLATSSMDRSIKFWDLETFEVVDTIGPEALPPRAIRFSTDGSCMLSATQEGLRVYGWEPSKQFDWVDAAWTKVSDLSLHEGKLIGCSFHQTFVGVWVVDLNRVRPFGHPEQRSQSSNLPSQRRSESDRNSKKTSPQDAAPSGRISRSSSESGPQRISESVSQSLNVVGSEPQARSRARPSSGGPPVVVVAAPPPAAADAGTGPVAVPKSMVSVGTGIGQSLPRSGVDFGALSLNGDGDPAAGPSGREAGDVQPSSGSREAASGRSSHRRQRTPDLPRLSAVAAPSGDASVSTPAPQPQFAGPQPQGLDLEAFLPATAAPSTGSPKDLQDEEVLAEVLGKHTTMSAILTTRASNLQVVHGFWSKGDVRGAMAALKRCQDQSVAADVMAAISHQRDLLKLEHCAEVGPLLEDLLASTHERWQTAAIEVSQALVRSFGQIIRDTLGGPVSNIGIDMAMEARRDKCSDARRALQALVPRLATTKKSAGAVGRKSSDLLTELEAL